jgi:drug/metabolite transporter (DMT)-like permease
MTLLDSPRIQFWIPTLVWASTWHVILYQLQPGVSPLLAVSLRFAIAAALLFALVAARAGSVRIAPRWHGWLAATGIVQYSVNYWGVYEAERHIPSGLVAVLYALMVFINAIGAWWAFGQSVTRRFLLYSACGMAGVVMIFWPEVLATGARPQAAYGLAIGLGAVVFACAGNLMSLRLTRAGLALMPVLAWSMGYGALALLLAAVAGGQPLRLGTGASWWVSLAYLACIGTVVAFVMYFRYAQQVGPARAALSGVAIPPLALAISALFEGWRPNALALAGLAVCVGSVWAATRPGVNAPAAATPTARDPAPT